MKLRNKLALITTTAALAFVGTGFAAWAFTASVGDSADVAGKATAAIKAEQLRVTDGAGHDIDHLYLICDAPDTAHAGIHLGNGIYWSTENVNNLTYKVTTLTLVGSVTEHDENILDFTKYVGHFTSTATAAVNGTYVDFPATAALDADVTSVGTDDAVSYVWDLPIPAYDTIPACVTDVDALKTEVNAISLTFSFTFNVKSLIAA